MARPIALIKEVDLQKKCKDAIIDLGGFSMKMSNRFLIGVPDLLCQLPGQMTSFWEVKTSNSMHSDYQATPLTPNQKMWLRKHADSGGFGGVIHFVMQSSDLHVAIYPTSRFPYRELKWPWYIYKKDLVRLPRNCKFVPFKELILRIHKEQGPLLTLGGRRTETLSTSPALLKT